MMKRKSNRPLAFGADTFLRSINLCFDAVEPDRIAHFRPTTKSIPLIRGLLADGEERSFLVVAPYGSGKSLTLTYVLNIIENRPDAKEVLGNIEKRIETVSPSLRKTLRARRRQKKHGLVLALHGFHGNLPKAIRTAAMEAIKRNKLGRQGSSLKSLKVSTVEDAIVFLRALEEVCAGAGRDHLCILWDETGRHLETLITEGRAAELSDIQVLAEYASRSSSMPVTFGITLHQSMLHYAQQMPQSVRAEWMKISGRFETIQYVDDSKETYRLIAEIVEANRGEVKPPPKKILQALARTAKKSHGLFIDFTIAELSGLLERTYPVNPAALYILPRVSARVAQNERTLFTFLYAASIGNAIDVPALYDYFAPSMRSDTAVGGTHKQWLETESAISKTGGNKDVLNILKAACLLSLGTKGERTRIEKSTLLWAVQGYGSGTTWKKAISDLIDKKLLLYRKHSKEVSVWHGTDVDLRGHLADEILRHRSSFDLLHFLNQETQPEAWKPVEYNTRYGVTRYWSGKYYTASDFERLSAHKSPIDVPVGRDGAIAYLVAESGEELCDAQNLALNHLKSPQIVVAIPSTHLRLRDAALEVWCLSQMQHNSDLTGEDPFVLPEIQQLLDDARANLQAVLDKILRPMPEGPRWFNQGKPLSIVCASQLRQELSRITEAIFPNTPRIHNELINRHKPSGTIVNSRKKLLMGILERHGTADLGLKSTTPDASMFRTILCHTGLYHETHSGEWEYSSGKTQSLKDESGLKKVWGLIREFFEDPSDGKSKSPHELFDVLVSPPFGIRRGLLPIFFATGMKAFAKAVALRHRDGYVMDVLPTVIEDVCKNPDDYELDVIDLSDSMKEYFETIRDMFLGSQRLDCDRDIIRATYDAIQSWLFQLPKASLTSEALSGRAKSFQRLLQRARTTDPVAFLLQDMPQACGYDYQCANEVRNAVVPLKDELENVSDAYVRKACDSIHQALSRNQTDRVTGIRRMAKRWASYFPDTITSASLPSIARGLLSRMRTPYDDEVLFVNSVGLLLVGKSTEDWDDSTAMEFENRIQDLTYRIETTALRASTNSRDLGESQEIREGLSNLVTERIEDLYDHLVQLVGTEQSSNLLQKIMKGNGNGRTK